MERSPSNDVPFHVTCNLVEPGQSPTVSVDDTPCNHGLPFFWLTHAVRLRKNASVVISVCFVLQHFRVSHVSLSLASQFGKVPLFARHCVVSFLWFSSAGAHGTFQEAQVHLREEEHRPL